MPQQHGAALYTHLDTILSGPTPYLRQVSPPLIVQFIVLCVFPVARICLQQHLHHCIHINILWVFFILYTRSACYINSAITAYHLAHLEHFSWHRVSEDSVQHAAVVLQCVGHVEVDQLYHRCKLQWFSKTVTTIPMADPNQPINATLPTWKSNSFRSQLHDSNSNVSSSISNYLRVRVCSPGTLAARTRKEPSGRPRIMSTTSSLHWQFAEHNMAKSTKIVKVMDFVVFRYHVAIETVHWDEQVILHNNLQSWKRPKWHLEFASPVWSNISGMCSLVHAFAY